jgi:cystathionine gamma-synthase
MRPETLAVHAGYHVDAATGAVAMPIHLSTTFERAADGGFPSGFIYTRSSNPNRTDLEAGLAAIEGGAAAAAFGSGSAATMAILQALAPGDHVIAPIDTYHGTRKLLREVFASWGLTASFVDMSDTDAVRVAVQPSTRLIWAETPSNPRLLITDLAAMAEIARGAGAILVCDNTWGTPVCQRPFEHGADLVLHSTTKYIGGHSDVLGGAVIGKVEDAFFARIRLIQGAGGAVPSPFDCWLTLRGVRSLHWRMRGHVTNAAAVAAFLHDHPAIEAVHYPGLPDHPGHAVAARQMDGFGGMVSCQVRGDAARAMAVAAKVRIFIRATSLGGVESLIEHRASIEGPDTPTPPNLLRLSIGLEHHEDLIEDLAQALEV